MPQSRSGHRISNSTLWLIILAGLLPSVVSALVNTQTQRMLLTQASKSLQVSADRLSASFNEHVDSSAHSLRALAGSLSLTDVSGSRTRLASKITLMKANSPTFAELLLISADGSLLASTLPQQEQSSLKPALLLQQANGSSRTLSAVKLSDAYPEGLLFSSIVPGRSDSDPLVLLGFVPLDRLAAQVERFGLGYSGLAILADARNRILACSFSELSGKTLDVLDQPPARGDSFPGSQRSARRTGAHYSVVSRSLSADPDSLRILVAQSRAEILESSMQSSSWSFITVAVITPIILILGLVFTTSVRRSLDSLITGTRKIAQGDFTPLNIGKSYWEIGELAKSFEQMTTSLAKNRQRLLQYQMGLEDLVAQKTKQLRQSERKYRTLYESSRDALMLISPQAEFISGNSAAVKLFGFEDEQQFTSTSLDQCSPEHQPDGTLSSEKAKKMIEIAMKDGSHFFDWICTRAGGEEFISTILLTRIDLDDQELVQATVRDVTENKRLQDMLVEQAEIDQLTQLWNRRALLTHLRQAWARRQRYGDEFSLIMLDIDQFKQLNDTYGHQAGDEALQQVAHVLLSQCRESDFAARYGGEEFTIVCTNTGAQEAVNLAERCRRQLEDVCFDFQQNTLTLTASFGVADAGDLQSTEALIQRADEALYRAKRAGRNRVELLTHTQHVT